MAIGHLPRAELDYRNQIAIPFFKSKDVNYFDYDAYASDMFIYDHSTGANGNVFRVARLRSSLSSIKGFSERKGSLLYTYR